MISSKHILCLFLLLIVFAMPIFAQTQNNMIIGKYPKGRLFLYDGRILEGKNLIMSGDSASMMVYGVTQNFSLSEIQQITAKKGHASFFASCCGLGCIGISALSYAITGGEYEDEDGVTQKLNLGEYTAGVAIWTAMVAVGGYLVGYIFDDWAIVYYLPNRYDMKQTSLNKFGKSSKDIPLLALKSSF